MFSYSMCARASSFENVFFIVFSYSMCTRAPIFENACVDLQATFKSNKKAVVFHVYDGLHTKETC